MKPTPAADRCLPAWDDHPWTGFPPASGELTADACVVGLGGSGLAAIAELLAMGRSVIGVDAGSVAGGAAGRNGGFLLAGTAAFHHDSVATIGRERAVAIYRLTLDEIERIAAEVPEAVRRTGSIRLAMSDDEREDCGRQMESMVADDLPVAWHERGDEVGLAIPTDCAFHPMLRARTLASRAAAAGARLHERSPVIAVSRRLVETPSARVACERVIVATDGGLRSLVPAVAARVRNARLQMLATEPLPVIRWPGPVYARYGYDYWQQLPDGRLLLGGCRDMCVDEEWTDDPNPSVAIQSLLDGLLLRLGVVARVTHRWAATVAYTEDEMPIFEEVDDGVWAIGAYSGTGNVIGALCGRGAARAAFGEPSAAATLLRSA